jgi:aminoglycoside 3-N-acetyltransferase
VSGLGFDSRDLALALDDLGVVAGDLVYFQVCAEPGPGENADDACIAIYRALRDVIGPKGTILAPTFTFSFCRNQPFVPETSATTGGPYNSFAAFPEYLRKRPDAVRSEDPIFSVAGEGPLAQTLLTDLPHECLGHDCVFDRVRQANGKIVLLGIGLFEAVFRHYVESVLHVPWRYDKQFVGRVLSNGASRREAWTYNVRIWAPNGDPVGEPLEAIALAEGVGRERKVGDTFVQIAHAQPFYDLCVRELIRDPWSTAAGPKGDPVEIERTRVGFPRNPPAIPRSASMAQVSDAIRPLQRDLLSAGFDAALSAFAARVPITIERWRTGERAGGWIIPEEWNCRSASVETLDGVSVLDGASRDTPLRRYARSFDGIVTRHELLARIETDDLTPNVAPFSAGWLDREWGFCTTAAARDALTEARYRVHIDTSFSMGALGIGAWRVDGYRPETILLTAHLTGGRPDEEMVDGSIVATELMRALSAREKRRYSYLLLLSPEPIGSAPYFERYAACAEAIRANIQFGSLGSDGDLLLHHASPNEFTAAALRADHAAAISVLDERASAASATAPSLELTRVRSVTATNRGAQLGSALRSAFALIDAIEQV